MSSNDLEATFESYEASADVGVEPMDVSLDAGFDTDDISIDASFEPYDAMFTASVVGVGFKGDTGKSAYDIAVEQGFVGTEAEWIASLNPDLSNYVTFDDMATKDKSGVVKYIDNVDFLNNF